MGRSKGQTVETPSPRKKRRVINIEHRQTGAQALVPQKLLPSPSASKTDVLDRYHLREKLKVVPRSVLKS